MKRVALLGLLTMAVTVGLGAAGCGGDDEPYLSPAERCAVVEIQAESCVEAFCRANPQVPYCKCFAQTGRPGLNPDTCQCEGSFLDDFALCDDELHESELLECEDLSLELRYEGMCRTV